MNKIKSLISANNICCGCGTCVSVCPQNAIMMKVHKGVFIPEINYQVCVQCGLCDKACPNMIFNYQKVNNPLAVYSGYSKDGQIRFESSSGGVITQLLLEGLERHMFDAVVVCDANEGLVYKPILTNKTDVVKRAKGSKYTPVSVNMILKEILKSNFNKVCIVGLPCHIRGLKAYSGVTKGFNEKIAFSINLVCGQTPKITAIEYLLHEFKLRRIEVNRFDFRGNGWPGDFKIYMKDGSIRKINFKDRLAMGGLFSSSFFIPTACQICPDHYGTESDISVCDAWHKYKDAPGDPGISSIICWSARGESLIKRFDKIFINPDTMQNILKTQGQMAANFKKEYLLKSLIKNDKRIKIKSEFKPNIRDKITVKIYLIILYFINKVNPMKINKHIIILGRGLKKFLT